MMKYIPAFAGFCIYACICMLVYKKLTTQNADKRELREIKRVLDKNNAKIKSLEESFQDGRRQLQAINRKLRLLTDSERSRTQAEAELPSCSICFQEFDENLHHLSCITKCFHTFCFSCLSSKMLSPKICPACRTPFTSKDVQKLF